VLLCSYLKDILKVGRGVLLWLSKVRRFKACSTLLVVQRHLKIITAATTTMAILLLLI